MHADEAYDMFVMAMYAKDKKFIIETGSGYSTRLLAKVAKEYKSIFISIDLTHDHGFAMPWNCLYLKGWSITKKDLVATQNGDVSKYGSELPEHRVLFENCEMTGETDLLRVAINSFSNICPPDFVFLDSGEYSTYAEWLIINEFIKLGCIICVHDIYYPKSIKGYRIVNYVNENQDKFKFIEETNTPQGLLIVQKIGE